jgi:hypothetical protein
MSCTEQTRNMVLLVQPISTFGYDDSMGRYLRSTDRSDVADAADKAEYLTGDEEVYANPELYFDQARSIFGIGAAFKRTFTQIWLRQFQRRSYQ